MQRDYRSRWARRDRRPRFFLSRTGWIVLVLVPLLIAGGIALGVYVWKHSHRPLPAFNMPNYMGAIRHAAKKITRPPMCEGEHRP